MFLSVLKKFYYYIIRLPYLPDHRPTRNFPQIAKAVAFVVSQTLWSLFTLWRTNYEAFRLTLSGSTTLALTQF